MVLHSIAVDASGCSFVLLSFQGDGSLRMHDQSNKCAILGYSQ
jgi:hypothetical protein